MHFYLTLCKSLKLYYSLAKCKTNRLFSYEESDGECVIVVIQRTVGTHAYLHLGFG